MALKTSIIYRPFLWMEIKQNIDNMLYNATDIIIAYEKNTWKRKDVTDFIKSKDTQEYIKLLETLKTANPVFTLKRWKYWGSWMCQELLIDFMMRVSPEFKHMAIWFVLEWLQLAGKRTELKEWYKKMCEAISKSEHSNYREEATMINVIVTWSIATNQRARLNITEMTQMDQLQLMNAWLIKAWISFEERKNILEKSLS